MNKLTIITAILLASVTLTGCSTVKGLLGKRDNGSLDYQQSQKLDPIKLPEGQATAEFTPLYPTPTVGKNTLELTNESGSQYQLPAPPKVHN